jgi:hypothetical protein
MVRYSRELQQRGYFTHPRLTPRGTPASSSAAVDLRLPIVRTEGVRGSDLLNLAQPRGGVGAPETASRVPGVSREPADPLIGCRFRADPKPPVARPRDHASPAHSPNAVRRRPRAHQYPEWLRHGRSSLELSSFPLRVCMGLCRSCLPAHGRFMGKTDVPGYPAQDGCYHVEVAYARVVAQSGDSREKMGQACPGMSHREYKDRHRPSTDRLSSQPDRGPFRRKS